MKSDLRTAGLAALGVLAVSACGGGETAAAGAEQAATVSMEEPTGICRVLRSEQVATVIGDNDGGKEQHASEGELLKGIEQQHCRYLHADETNFSWLDLVVYRASSDEAFEQIRIAEWAHQGSSQRLEIGDIGYLDDTSNPNETDATASKGKTVFELSLHADNAADKSEQLTTLARIVGEAVWGE